MPFGEERKATGMWAGRRLLWRDEKPAFELSVWCGTCQFPFKLLEGANDTASLDECEARLADGIDSLDQHIIDRFASLLPLGGYVPTPRILGKHLGRGQYHRHVTRRRSTILVSAFAAVLVAVSGCGLGGTAHKLDLTATGYLQPGTEFWDGWTVPAGTVGLATPFPLPDPEQVKGMPRDTESVSVDFLVTGDVYEVMRDLHAQIGRQGLRPVVTEEQGPMCEERGRIYVCELYGQGEDGFTKLAAELEVTPSPRPGDVSALLQISLVEYSYDDYSSSRAERAEESRTAWVSAVAPEGEAPVSAPDVDPDALVPGAELTLFRMEERVGTVPEGSRLLAPPYNAAATYGFAGIFVITDRHDEVLAELEAMAAEAWTGDRLPDQELTAGDLTAHRVSFEGSGGGCGAELDSVDLGSDLVAAALYIFCD